MKGVQFHVQFGKSVTTARPGMAERVKSPTFVAVSTRGSNGRLFVRWAALRFSVDLRKTRPPLRDIEKGATRRVA